MTDKIFKQKLTEIFEQKIKSSLSDKSYAFIELDTQMPKNRIEYPGYDKDAQFSGGYNPEYLPGFRSCVSVIMFINRSNRKGYTKKGRNRWLGEGFDPEDEVNGTDDAGVYENDIFLLVAKSHLSESFRDKTDQQKIDELIRFSHYTIEQIDEWGIYPIFYEPIPEINGCIPEQIYPHSEKHLTKILTKIKDFGNKWYYLTKNELNAKASTKNVGTISETK